MEFSSTLYHMTVNPNHYEFNQKAYNTDQPIYVWKDNTVYKRMAVWQRDFRTWLRDNGVEVDTDSNIVYTPISHYGNGVLTGWHTQYPNIANRFLDMNKAVRESYYPNLYFVQVGNHPYPKEGRFPLCWLLIK